MVVSYPLTNPTFTPPSDSSDSLIFSTGGKAYILEHEGMGLSPGSAIYFIYLLPSLPSLNMFPNLK